MKHRPDLQKRSGIQFFARAPAGYECIGRSGEIIAISRDGPLLQWIAGQWVEIPPMLEGHPE